MLSSRHDARGSLAEPLGLDSEGTIEAGAVILPGDRRGQLDQLRRSQVLFERMKQFVGHLDGRVRHRLGVPQHQLLQLRKRGARFEIRQVGKLRFGDPFFSADGRTNVNSKRTADEHGSFD